MGGGPKDKHIHPLEFLVTWNIIAVLSVIVNMIHLTVVSTQPELKKRSYLNFKLFLIITGVWDLVMGILWSLFSNEVFQNFLRDYPPLCVATAVYMNSKNATHVTFLLLVSVDRAVCIRKCIKYQQRKFVKVFPAVMGVTCIFFPLVYSVEGILYGEVFKPFGFALCFYRSLKPDVTPFYAPNQSYIVICVLAIIILNAYAAILAKVKLSKSKNQRRYNRMIEVTKVLTAIIVWTILTWIPLIVDFCLHAAGKDFKSLFYGSVIVLGLDNAMTPFLYSLTNQTYRRAVVSKFFPGCCHIRILQQSRDSNAKIITTIERSSVIPSISGLIISPEPEVL